MSGARLGKILLRIFPKPFQELLGLRENSLSGTFNMELTADFPAVTGAEKSAFFADNLSPKKHIRPVRRKYLSEDSAQRKKKFLRGPGRFFQKTLPKKSRPRSFCGIGARYYFLIIFSSFEASAKILSFPGWFTGLRSFSSVSVIPPLAAILSLISLIFCFCSSLIFSVFSLAFS